MYRSTIDKTKSTTDSRKKSRTQGTWSNSVTRKLSTNGRRGSTTSAPIASKRVSSSRPKYRTVSRPRTSNEEDREVSRRSYDPSSDEETESGNTVTVTEKVVRANNRNRSKTSSNSADRNSRRKQSRRKGPVKADEDQQSLSNRLTTPEPPTTPDPGTGKLSNDTTIERSKTIERLFHYSADSCLLKEKTFCKTRNSSIPDRQFLKMN